MEQGRRMNHHFQLDRIDGDAPERDRLGSSVAAERPYLGQRWLVEERDACGVGFIAHQDAHASHETVAKALSALSCLEHRGGCSADCDSGDGAGLMSAIPWTIVHQWLREQNQTIPAEENTAVGMVFLPADGELARVARETVEHIVTREGLDVLGWREVPVCPEVLGPQARAVKPQI